MCRNAFQVFDAKSAIPYGALPPISWVMPKTAGGMSASRTGVITTTVLGTALMGVPIEGSSQFVFSIENVAILPVDDSSPLRTGSSSFSISVVSLNEFPEDDTPQIRTGSSFFAINVSDLVGELVVSGQGSASVHITAPDALLLSSLSGAGVSNISIAFASAILGAEASGTGTASLIVSASPVDALPDSDVTPLRSGQSSFLITATSTTRFPLNDSPTLRTGSSTLQINGQLVPYAVGIMSGSTDDSSVITPDAVAQAVWGAAATDSNASGSMGRKLNDVSGGVSGGGLTEEQNAAILGAHQEAKLARQLSGNKALIVSMEDGSKVISIYADDGVSVIRTLTISANGSVRELV